MPTKEEAKNEMAKLITDFNANPRKDNLSEEDTRSFIDDFFKILGWNFRNMDEVYKEEKTTKGFPDYCFKLSGVPTMFVEAKKTSISIQEEGVTQVIDYAWHKATTWAVLTNFKRLRIFNSYIRESIMASQLKDLEIHEYMDKFDIIWLLSKESFESHAIDKFAEDAGKKAKEKSVEKALFEDINQWRQELAKDVKKNYAEKYSTEEIDEMVQVLLDRFILVRKIEDEGLEGKKLEAIFHNWLDAKNKKSLWMYLRELFTTAEDSFDQVYDSRIFEFSEVDKLEISDYPLKIILQGLYESQDKTIRYNFAFIDADILGNIYEQYLGYLLKTTAKRAKGEESKAKRKEQGIYYTPRYIVDYIVKNTLGEKLKDCKSWEEVEKIKVLDPACGSGSFLIRAFDEIHDWYKEKGLDLNKLTAGEGGFETVKDKILKKNIYGVDLDQKAVDIAQLNLLLKTADKKHRLPQLRENIKCGNSLIDDEKVAGDKAFKWNEQFKQIMDNGGFDIVIGNPPYIKIEQIKNMEKNYLFENFKNIQGRTDLYILFIEKALNLLKDNGIMSFIVPSIWLKAKYGELLKKEITQNYSVKAFLDFGDLKVFDKVTTYPCIIVIQKSKPNKAQEFRYLRINQLSDNITRNLSTVFISDSKMAPQELFLKGSSTTGSKNNNQLFEKIKNSSKITLATIRDQVYEGFITGDNKIYFVGNEAILKYGLEKELIKKTPKAKNIKKYDITWKDEYVIYPYHVVNDKTLAVNMANYPKTNKYLSQFEKKLKARKSLNGTNKKWFEYIRPREKNWFERPKIITPNISATNNFALDLKPRGEYYVDHDAYAITVKSNDVDELIFICGLLNSRLAEFFVKNISPMFSGGYYKYHTQYLDQIPVIANNKEKIVNSVKKILGYTDNLTKIDLNQNKQLSEKIKNEEENLNKIIYETYGITKEERKIIEESLGAK